MNKDLIPQDPYDIVDVLEHLIYSIENWQAWASANEDNLPLVQLVVDRVVQDINPLIEDIKTQLTNDDMNSIINKVIDDTNTKH